MRCSWLLQAVDKNTLLQLRGATHKGYAFDRRYEQDVTSDQIYDDCIAQLVESVFKVRHMQLLTLWPDWLGLELIHLCLGSIR